MRRAMLFALMMSLCLPLWGCGEQENQTGEIQAQFQAITAAETEADLTCHYGEELRTYTLRCRYTPERSEVTVKSPEELAGVSAVLEGEKLTLAYDDVILDAGAFSGTEISPMWAVPSMLQAIGSGYPVEVCREDLGEEKCLRATFEVTAEDGGKRCCSVWFDEENTPLQGEITIGETVVYAAVFREFTTEEPEDGTTAAENMGGD